ncbi:glycosyltransferase family 90 protein [Hortaea werneckii]|nr:glycosyltransferase family 90 protein [Hortaea werneckii]KAI7626310.1 glycosyltransferase family 90 protein [Hortaea werneckii]KAI7672751.1 glycosyltransferase family 90 protein [Hortaea werneckii]KAI7709405.1 glycosyltransferase family 90 protein [Hortaea werneckii]
MAHLSAPAVNTRFAQYSVSAIILLAAFWFILPSLDALPVRALHSHPKLDPHSPHTQTQAAAAGAGKKADFPPKSNHPIDTLIARAEREFEELLAKETHTVHDAAAAYRERRGRQPPPHFDQWFEFAENHSTVIVEDFWDQIYHDLAPFWGVPAKAIREQANDFIHRISVRNGNTTQRTDIEGREWLDLWEDMVRSVAPWLPDVDLPINVMDESRMVVPWEEIDSLMAKESRSRQVVPEAKLKTQFETRKDLDEHPPPKFDPGFNGAGPYWPLAVVGCHADSPARSAYIETDFSTPPPISGSEYPRGSYHGYVQNWTLAKSSCDNPHLQGLHGTFIEPISISNTKKLFPLFGGSKLPMNNEILLPPAMYYTTNPFYSGGKTHGQPWEEKTDSLIWRGAASGGRNRASNWRRFQRHRFVSMTNSTSVRLAETSPHQHPPPSFVLPTNNTYDLAATHIHPSSTDPSPFASWLAAWANTAVVNLLCFPGTGTNFCPYTDPYFLPAPVMPMKEQYAHKYLADIDGNSFSGRYRGFLGSTSLPIKATIYDEWHDSRLVPWVHFVPMDNTFVDLYGLMEFFVGYVSRDGQEGVGGRDEVAKKIALRGKEWAERVLRREDMQVYVFRLLLEYARVCDDEREAMGWRESG